MLRRLLPLILVLAAGPLLAKSLHWRALDVTARLDADGRLHVSERQAFVFDGDWNGGERTFAVRAGQSLDFESIARVDDGVERRLAMGDLDKVDHFAFASPKVLRWRSRLPGDPDFANTEITYVLRYTLSGVLRESDGNYTLNHDFAFPDRKGVIENFSLNLDIDPAWRGSRSSIVIARRALQRGESVIVRETLAHAGASAPTAAVHATSPKTSLAILVAILFGLALIALDFYFAEDAKGRFARLVSPSEIDEAWLSENLLTLAPEVAGAALDEKVGAAHVAAVLARMTNEGKIATSVETRRRFLTKHQVLCLRLMVDRDSLHGYEAKLVKGLFFGDRKETDTDAIRTKYQGVGFDPAAIVDRGLKEQLSALPDWGKTPPRTNWKRTTVYVAGAALLMIFAATRGGNDTGVVIFVGVAGAILLGCAVAAANANARAITGLGPRFAIPLLLLAPVLWLVAAYIRKAGVLLLHGVTLIALAAWAPALMKMTLDALRIRETARKIELRKRLAAARNYFIAQLRSPAPRLRDAWYPYFLAFGLGSQVERWFSTHARSPGVASHSVDTTSSSSSGSTSSAGGWSWSGGGGAFGGAGATGGWAIAASTLASGVASPSSGSSGSSSSSGGSSSGGGGGGGW
ncbi:MAG: DUF2207 domain-containing protein [Thermoanaerobaculia bacterium]